MNFIEVITTQIGLKDLIDILVVAIIIYQVLLIIQGTRAAQMLLGIGLLSILFWFALSYKLYSVNWVLNHFFESFFIIFIILFQDQIRLALTQAGAKRRFLKSKKSFSVAAFEEVVDACGAMSREKIGALIVFERDHGLLNYIQTGSRLEANLHSDLIYALFQSSSPLHDGAIIIQNGTLCAAGCFLPLSKNIELDRHMGTRHRAALGISEQSDAIVVTVSEETGKINVVFEGKFYPIKDELQLRQYLKFLHTHDKVDELAVLNSAGAGE